MAVASLLLPVVGLGLALYGAYEAFKGDGMGWLWLSGGILVLVADLVIDILWERRAESDEPALNRRGAQLVGEVVIVTEPILAGGRGSVRAADSVWPAEGAEAARGARVRVTGCKGTVLTVEVI